VSATTPLGPEDLSEVLELNERWVPHVGTVTREALEELVARASLAVAVRRPAGLAGFVIVLAPGADYASPNYRFFQARLDGGAPTFRYVDRIAVAPWAQGTGVGRLLYEAVVDHARAAGAGEVTCEVNLQPPNPDSQAFHAALGFVEVGRQWTYGGTTEVQLLARDVTA
jgi:uncharacterized protein